jgi:hypothetical protein
MRFKVQPEPLEGATQEVKKFAWIPKNVSNVENVWVWLEYYTSFQEFVCERLFIADAMIKDDQESKCAWYETDAHAILKTPESEELENKG